MEALRRKIKALIQSDCMFVQTIGLIICSGSNIHVKKEVRARYIYRKRERNRELSLIHI